MKNKILKFPKGFLWGAATSAHQVEGGTKNDWTQWEKKNAKRLAKEAKTKWATWQQKKFPEMFDPENYVSGRACDHYNRYEDDFDIAKSLGHNAHRFSIEWSRIEPEEGKFDEKEIEHYRKVIKAIRAQGMEPFVTLWHWTNPIWLEKNGGWESKKSVYYFSRYVEKVVKSLGDNVNFWLVINEPNVHTGFGYLLGTQPPGKKSIISFLRTYFHLLDAYKKSYRIIHGINPKAKVSFAHSTVNFEADIWRPLNKSIVAIINFFSEYFSRKTSGFKDFITCNYYIRIRISFKKIDITDDKRTDLGWEICPEGIYHILLNQKKYNLPIYITENGIADEDDSRRKKYIKEHLQFIYAAIRHGVDIRGYLHWSLLDNFEAPEVRGFWPRFGLVEIDYKTLERKIRPSAWEYAKICKSNQLEIKNK